MRDEVVRLKKRANAQRGAQWDSRALPARLAANRAASVVVPFPQRSHLGQVELDVAKLLASLELENTQLRRQVVELALQIQELKERRR